jgi:leucyl aminopeptidase
MAEAMLELPDFAPLRVTLHRGSRRTFDSLDHLLIVCAEGTGARALQKFPQGRQLGALLARAREHGDDFASSRASNRRATGLTIAACSSGSAFTVLSWARRVVAECTRDKPATLGIAFVADALSETDARAARSALVAAAAAAAFGLPTFKTTAAPPRLKTLQLFGDGADVDLDAVLGRARGNNVARWLTALPPNVLTAAAYRSTLETLARAHGLRYRFLDETRLRKLGAGAFLAVSQGNADRDAGIAVLSYRPRRERRAALALVGKGIVFDTGGTNLKTFKGMLDMHTDMQGSAVALGTLLALAALDAPFGVDAWLAISPNQIGPTSYKSQDVVHAANGTSIQVIHTDAEGRMVLADTLALASREKPELIVDYATLTGACVIALAERYSGVFTNRAAANRDLVNVGAQSGERVWPFPMDDDFDELLKSDVADIKQCSAETQGDHILAARFLQRFVPSEIPWVHVDLSAGQHKGGLAHVPSEITGFGVGFTLELLREATPAELAKRWSA